MRLPTGDAITVAETDVAYPELLDALLGADHERLDALDRVQAVNQRREYSGLITATRSDLQNAVQRSALEERLGHTGNYVGLRNGLAKTYWQRGVFIGTAAKRLIHKDVARHIPNAIQHSKVRDALITKPLYETIPRARGCHAYSSESNVNHQCLPANSAPPAVRNAGLYLSATGSPRHTLRKQRESQYPVLPHSEARKGPPNRLDARVDPSPVRPARRDAENPGASYGNRASAPEGDP